VVDASAFYIDRAMLFEDPTGVHLVHDVGASVASCAEFRHGFERAATPV